MLGHRRVLDYATFSVSQRIIHCCRSHTKFNQAGDAVTVEMHQQPGDRSCANEAIGGDHWGPVLVSTNVDC